LTTRPASNVCTEELFSGRLKNIFRAEDEKNMNETLLAEGFKTVLRRFECYVLRRSREKYE
jgi:hypothetical protein